MFCQQIEDVEWKAALPKTGAIKGLSTAKRYKVLGLKFLKFRTGYIRLCTLSKIKIIRLTYFLQNYIQKENRTYAFKKYFSTCKSQIVLTFKNSVLNIGCPSPNLYYNIFKTMGLKLLTRLRLGSCYLDKHKFNRKLPNYFHSKCSCSLLNEDTVQFFLYSHRYIIEIQKHKE